MSRRALVINSKQVEIALWKVVFVLIGLGCVALAAAELMQP